MHEFLLFGLKQARACVFAGSFFLLLFLSNHIPLALRDTIFSLLLRCRQAILYFTKLETKDEVKVIFLFQSSASFSSCTN